MSSLIQHQKSIKHCSCPHCDPFDTHEALLEARLYKYPCPECHRRFALKPALEAHQCEDLHTYCYDCDVLSSTRQLHVLHMQSHAPILTTTSSSATQFRCCDCERDFINEGALTDHPRCSKKKKDSKKKEKKKKKKEKRKKQREEGNRRKKCKKCERTFKSRAALGRHLTSMRHHPLSDIKCVADAECKKQFNCPSAQLQHLETGRCISGMTKTKLNAAIAANDTGRIITSEGATAQWLLEDNSSATSTSQIRNPIPTPTSTEFLDFYPPSAIPTSTSTLSTSTNFHSMLTLRPRTRSGYQTCPHCPPYCTRTFKNSELQQHLSSVHAQVSMSLSLIVPDGISFHCPRTLMGEKSKREAIRQFSERYKAIFDCEWAGTA